MQGWILHCGAAYAFPRRVASTCSSSASTRLSKYRLADEAGSPQPRARSRTCPCVSGPMPATSAHRRSAWGFANARASFDPRTPIEAQKANDCPSSSMTSTSACPSRYPRPQATIWLDHPVALRRARMEMPGLRRISSSRTGARSRRSAFARPAGTKRSGTLTFG